MKRKAIVRTYSVQHPDGDGYRYGDSHSHSHGGDDGGVDRASDKHRLLLFTHATGFLDRLRGLIGRPPPVPGAGLWIEPCNAVHSFGMRYPIDLVFVDRRGQVVAVRPHLKPCRTAACAGAAATVEMAAGEVARLRIAPGSRLVPIFVRSAMTTDQEDKAMSPNTSATAPNESAEMPGNDAADAQTDAADAQTDAAATTSHATATANDASITVNDLVAADTHRPANAPTGKSNAAVPTIRRTSSRPARAAAIAAVAAASIISGNAKADAAANMNLGYDFLDELAGEQTHAVSPGAGMREPIESASDDPESSSATAPIERESSGVSAPASTAPSRAFDAGELASRLAEAEGFYREARYDDAQRTFSAILAADPAHAHAWLRMGNLMHRKRNWFDALSAYRKAARPQADLAIREKAVYNIALLNLELARHALRRLEKLRNEAAAEAGEALPKPGVSDASVRQLSDQLGNAYASVAASRRSDGAVHPPGAASSGSARGSASAAKPARAMAAAPAPGPRTPKPLPIDKPVEVEIRQGGGAQ